VKRKLWTLLGLLLPFALQAEPRLPRPATPAPKAAAAPRAGTAAPAKAATAATAAAGKPAATAASAKADAASLKACDRFVGKLPNVNKALCEGSGLVASDARSVAGTPLYIRDVGPSRAPLRVMVIGGIHGDELSSASVALHWIRLAAEEQVEMPQPVHWRFVPMANPDGMLGQPPKRVNAHGVDLNRNFPTPDWERDAAVYWQKRTGKDPRRFPGPKPLSEPETRFLHEQMKSFKPHLIVSIHAPYGVLDFDGPSVPPSRLGRLYLDQVGIFPGSLGNYGGVHKGVPVVTIELPNSQRTPLDAEMRQMWLDLLRWTAAKVNGDGPASR
jgi:protein MpaA